MMWTREWYESLIKMMELENVRERGHIRVCHNVLIRLNDLHTQLLADQGRFPDYHADYYRTLPYIVQLRATLPEQERPSELETCFNALYGVMMLHLQGKEISQDTAAAISQISHFIGLLAAYYKRGLWQSLIYSSQAPTANWVMRCAMCWPTTSALTPSMLMWLATT